MPACRRAFATDGDADVVGVRRRCAVSEMTPTMSLTTASTSLRVVALGHDADQRLGAGRADDQAAAVAEPVAGVFDRRLDRRALQRLAAGEADVLQELRHRLELAATISLTGLFCRLMQASTCSAETSPSPVVEKSDSTIWPDCSPPTFSPCARMCSTT